MASRHRVPSGRRANRKAIRAFEEVPVRHTFLPELFRGNRERKAVPTRPSREGCSQIADFPRCAWELPIRVGRHTVLPRYALLFPRLTEALNGIHPEAGPDPNAGQQAY
jgi:hypothetical protein